MTADEKKSQSPNIIDNEQELLQHGVSRVKLPSIIRNKLSYWSTTLSQVTPMNFTSEDGEYAFYRNIKEDPDFPFDQILKEEIFDTLKANFGVSKTEDVYLDDAFCIQYNMSYDDTTCAKHMDPSDITVNMCFEKSKDVTGSQVVFYGTQQLPSMNENNIYDEEYEFLVDQKEGYCTIHYGKHPHKTLPLLSGQRTNVILTYCFKDDGQSDALQRTCYL